MLIVRRLRRIRPQPLHRLPVLALVVLTVVLALGLCAPAPSHAQQSKAASTGNCTHPDPATRPDCPGAIAFLAKFQHALKRNDREALASLVNYPLLATPDKKIHIRSRAQLLANYDRVFSPQVRAAILKATGDDVWGSSKGFMIGRGVIWFDGIIPRSQHSDASAQGDATKYPFKVITVNPAYP
jgi:hypothetical protein